MPIWKCNGKEKVNNNQKKRIYFKILNLLLVIILVFSVASVGGCSMESKQGAKGAKSAGKRQSEDARFEEYTAELFCKEVSANTVSLHYTLKAPEKYGIEATDATFGQFEREPEAVKAAAENMRQALLGFNYDDLNVQNKITYDILNYRLKLMKKSADYTMYEEPLGLVSGVQTQLPVVLSEYPQTVAGLHRQTSRRDAREVVYHQLVSVRHQQDSAESRRRGGGNSDRAVPRLFGNGERKLLVFDVCRSSDGIKYIDRERKK